MASLPRGYKGTGCPLLNWARKVKRRVDPFITTLFDHVRDLVIVGWILFSDYGFRQLPGEDIHGLFNHILKDLTGWFDLMDNTGDLSGQTSHIVEFIGLHKAPKECGRDQDLRGEWERIEPGFIPKPMKFI